MKQIRAPENVVEASSAERILQNAADDQEISNAGQAMLSGALADMAEGKNEAFTLSEYPNKDEIPFIGYMRRSAPPELGAMARDKLLALSSQEHAARQVARVLTNPRPANAPQPNMLKKLFGGRDQ